MSGSVLVRDGHTITGDGVIHYQDRPVTWSEADEMAGTRLDRRKAWAFIDGELCESVRWSAACSGCNNELGGLRGCGCSECGYQGIAQQAMWVLARRAQDGEGG